MSKLVSTDEEYIYDGNVIICQLDLDGVVTFVNRKFCEVSGYEVDELIGLEHSYLLHPDMPQAILSKMWESIRGGQAWNGIIKHMRKDGRYYWVSFEILPNVNENGNITGYISVGKPASEKSIQENTELYEKMLSTEN